MNTIKLLMAALIFTTAIDAQNETVNILIRNNASEVIKHGVDILRAHLTEFNTSSELYIRKDYPKVTGTSIYIGNIANYLNKELAFTNGIRVPFEDNSYVIRKSGNNIFIFGSDDVGTMYGVYDLIEQMELKKLNKLNVEVISEKTETPYVEIRGVNPFLHTQALWDKKSWFYDLEFWKEYLGQLSFNRFNFLDVHGVYDLNNTDFFNFFAYFVKSDKFQNIGLSKKECDDNLAQLKRIVKMAKERGIKVGIMNYNFGSFIGGQPRPGRFRDDPKITYERLKGEELEAYIREVTSKLLKEIPDLWIFGFRIGESGKRLDFFQDTFLKGIQQSGRIGMPLYSRSWLTTRRLIDAMAQNYPGKLYLEIKYNGEHFGPPYQAITGMRPWHLSYSYEEYSDRPQNFELIWQIRFNGTHRIFHWGNADYVKRTVKTLHFAYGKGFTIEPMQAYFPMNDYMHDNSKIHHDYFKWGFQKDWFWNLLWGRLSYNPELNPRVWMYQFEKRFGKAAEGVSNLFQKMSEVIPYIYQTHCVGVDHRSDAPEFETGNGIDNHYPVDDPRFDKGIDNFIKISALDSASYMSPAEYVDEYLSQNYTGRYTPIQISEKFKIMADQILKYIAAASKKSIEPGSKEYDCIKMDAEMLASLAMYYSEKFLAAVDLQFYRKAGDTEKLTSALEHMTSAYAHWESLAETGEKHYKPLLEELRMRTIAYRWKDQLPFLRADIETIKKEISNLNDVFAERKVPEHKATGDTEPPVVKHRLTDLIIPSDSVKLTAKVTDESKIKWVKVYYKEQPSYIDWRSADMKLSRNDIYEITLPLNSHGLIYYFEAFDEYLNGKNYPDPKIETPYFVIESWNPVTSRR